MRKRGSLFRWSLPAIGLYSLLLALAVAIIAPSEARSQEIALEQHASVFTVESAIIGETYRIQVALPTAYMIDPDARFRVVYILDADFSFGMASEIAFLAESDFLQLTTEPVILVGIGYADPNVWAHRRTRDFSPPDSIDAEFLAFTEAMLGLPAESGGAPAFLNFLEAELHPEVKARFRVAGDTATLMSNSQGGVFGYYALLQNSPLFDRYWIGNPAIFGQGTYLVNQLAARLEQGFDRPTRIYMSLGELERTASLNGIMPMEMHQLSAESYDAIDALLSEVDEPNMIYRADVFPGETHNGVVAPAMNRAFRFLHDRTLAHD